MAINLRNYDPALMAGANIGSGTTTGNRWDILDYAGTTVIGVNQGGTSAINYVVVSNNNSGTAPSIAATGGDTNLGLQLSAAGTAIVSVGSLSTSTTLGSNGAGTANAQRVQLTTAPLYLAGTTAMAFNLANTSITPSSLILFSIQDGTNTQGLATVNHIVAGSGSCVFTIDNAASTASASPLNGTLKLNIIVL